MEFTQFDKHGQWLGKGDGLGDGLGDGWAMVRGDGQWDIHSVKPCNFQNRVTTTAADSFVRGVSTLIRAFTHSCFAHASYAFTASLTHQPAFTRRIFSRKQVNHISYLANL